MNTRTNRIAGDPLEEIMTTQITLPIDIDTTDGTDAVRTLLAAGLSTPETIAAAVDGCTWYADADAVLIDSSPWYAADGNSEIECEFAAYDDAEEVARAYIDGGDWGDGDCDVHVRVWRVGIDADGDDIVLDQTTHAVDAPSTLAVPECATGNDGYLPLGDRPAR